MEVGISAVDEEGTKHPGALFQQGWAHLGQELFRIEKKGGVFFSCSSVEDTIGLKSAT